MFHSYSLYLASHTTTHSLLFIHCKGYPTIGVTPPPAISSANQRVTPSVISWASVSHPVGNFISQSVSHSVSRSADSRWVTPQKFHQAESESPRQWFYQPASHPIPPSVNSSGSQSSMIQLSSVISSVSPTARHKFTIHVSAGSTVTTLAPPTTSKSTRFEDRWQLWRHCAVLCCAMRY